MSHLTDSELVDWLDSALPPHRATHLDACMNCRGKAERLRLDVSHVVSRRERDVPEPSPLFWEHLSQRVREAVHDLEPAPSVARWFDVRVWTGAAAAALVVTLVSWAALRSSQPPEQPAPPAQRPLLLSDDLGVNLDDDEEWALVRIVADDLRWEDAQEAGLSARPGAAERVALEMSAVERQELARLIEDELKRSGA